MQPKSEWANSFRVRNEARIEILGGRGGGRNLRKYLKIKQRSVGRNIQKR